MKDRDKKNIKRIIQINKNENCVTVNKNFLEWFYLSEPNWNGHFYYILRLFLKQHDLSSFPGSKSNLLANTPASYNSQLYIYSIALFDPLWLKNDHKQQNILVLNLRDVWIQILFQMNFQLMILSLMALK